MARLVVTLFMGFVVSTMGYYALHFVDLPTSRPETTSASSSTSLGSTELPDPVAGDSPPIRVCLTPSAVSSFRIQIDGPFALKALGSDRVLDRGESWKDSRVRCVGQTIRIGNRNYPGTRLEVVPENSPAVWVNGHQYRGRLRIYRQPGGKLLAVNVLPLEDYIASVVDSEMPAAFPKPARLAQAICARTYAVYQMAQARSHPYFDVYSTPRSQNYLGYQYYSNGRRLAGETPEGRQIAEETAGLVCTFGGDVFCTYYSAICGGQTIEGTLVFTDAAEPLQSVSCDHCRDAALYRWTEKFSRPAATRKLALLLGDSRNQVTSIRRADNASFTPASRFAVSAAGKTVHISAAELRRRLSLPSSTFEVWEDSGHFLFQGRGHGHGVGLCQWGARGLALKGKSAAEILSYYYPGSKVAPMPRPH